MKAKDILRKTMTCYIQSIYERKVVHMKQVITTATAVAALAIAALAGTASAAPETEGASGQIPEEARVVKVVEGTDPVGQIDKQEFVRRAEKAGVPLTETQLEEIAPAEVACWNWDAWRSAQNRNGDDLWKSHHRVNWCGDGSWIRVHAYVDRWGETFMAGWNDKGLTQEGDRYGVNWDQYNSWSQRKFCLVEYLNCVWESNPYTNVTVFPNGSTRWN